MDIIDTFRANWRNYLWQSLYATLGLLAILTVLSLQRAIIVASVGATAFIVFMKPNNPFARPRNVIGGHLVGLITGTVFSLLSLSTPFTSRLIFALAVGCAMFVMAVSNTEHPPAAGTALSVVTLGFSWPVAIAVITSAVLMAVFHEILKPYLKDL